MKSPKAAGLIRLEYIDSVLIITVDNPPVNANSPGLAAEVIGALQEARTDSSVEGVLLQAAGIGGFAGADINWQGAAWPEEELRTQDLVAALDAFPKPTVALIREFALGGGLELAMACKLRAAVPGTRLGLPEVTLGVSPGAGGTQRLPRLVGVEKALDMIIDGKPVLAEEALKTGLIDFLAPATDTLAETITWFRDAVKDALELPHVSKRPIPAFPPSVFDDVRARASRKRPGEKAPAVCIECVEAATRLPFEEALAFEFRKYEEGAASGQAAAFRYAFAAERTAQKVPGLDTSDALKINSAGIVGAGTMGIGIAIACVNAGLAVTVIEPKEDARGKAKTRIADFYISQAAKGRMSDHEARERSDNVSISGKLASLTDVDLIIEAAFEDIEVKKEIFSELAAIAKDDAILASNTSYLDLDMVAQATSGRAASVVGLHFFSPANIMPLLEIVRGNETSDRVLFSAIQLGKSLGKKAIVSRVCPGFIANRTFETYTREAEFLLQEGATPSQVDAALTAFGMPMGPFAVRDLAGLDIGWARRKSQASQRDPAKRYSRIGDMICEKGWFGQKTGKGFYLYDSASKRPMLNPEVEEIIRRSSDETGIRRRDITDDEIVERCFFQVINEAARVLEEGIAARASDVDLAWLAGYGFPRWRGGPLYWASEIGLGTVLDRIREFGATHDYWEPAPQLVRLAESQSSFSNTDKHYGR